MAKALDNLREAKLAFVDLETTGDIFAIHEIIEIGLVVVDQKSLEVVDELNIKVRPENIENAVPAALVKNGYKEEDWLDAISLREAVEKFAEKTEGSIFFAYNATFDWGFMNQAFHKTGVQDNMDYHRFDVLSMAFLKLKDKDIARWSLATLSKYLGVAEEPLPHRAINGARTAFEVYKKLTTI